MNSGWHPFRKKRRRVSMAINGPQVPAVRMSGETLGPGLRRGDMVKVDVIA